MAAIALLTGLAGDTWHGAYAQAAAASRAGMDAGAIEQGYRGLVADLVRVSFFALVSLGGLFLMLRGRLKPAIAIGLVGVVTLFDLLPVDTRLMQGVLGAPRELSAASEKDDVVDFLLQRKQQEPEFRIFPVREFQSNRYAGFGDRQPRRLPRREAAHLPGVPRRGRSPRHAVADCVAAIERALRRLSQGSCRRASA